MRKSSHLVGLAVLLAFGLVVGASAEASDATPADIPQLELVIEQLEQSPAVCAEEVADPTAEELMAPLESCYPPECDWCLPSENCIAKCCVPR